MLPIVLSGVPESLTCPRGMVLKRSTRGRQSWQPHDTILIRLLTRAPPPGPETRPWSFNFPGDSPHCAAPDRERALNVEVPFGIRDQVLEAQLYRPTTLGDVC